MSAKTWVLVGLLLPAAARGLDGLDLAEVLVGLLGAVRIIFLGERLLGDEGLRGEAGRLVD